MASEVMEEHSPPSLIANDTSRDDDDEADDDNKELTEKDRDNIELVIKNSEIVSGGDRFDSFLRGYVDWCASATYTERGLKLLQYLLWFSSRFTERTGSLSPTRFRPELSPGLRKMYFDLSMARYALRLYGLPLSIEAIRTGSWTAGEWKNKWIHRLGKIMAWSMVFYYPLEHVAYGHWVAPKLIKADAEKYTAISCRFWLAYIASDLLSSILKLKELERWKKEILNESKQTRSKLEVAKKLEDIRKLVKINRLHVLRCILYTLPGIHWSLPQWERRPWLKDGVLNGLMLAESITCFYQSLCSM